MSNYQNYPLKLYIQDLFRAKETSNKYIYELFGMTFKNCMIHGVVTSLNMVNNCMNIELSDPTGTIQIYHDPSKNNYSIGRETLRALKNNYIDASKFGDLNINIMTTLMERIIDKSKVFEEGCHASVVGDIFVDSTKNMRMISAYECTETSVEYDIVWLEELRYLYDKFYLKDKD